MYMYRSTYIQSVGTVSMEDNPWKLSLKLKWIQALQHFVTQTVGLSSQAGQFKKGKKCLKGLEDDEPSP